MREILFRGKRVNNGEWVYGNLIAIKDDTVFVIQEKTLLSTKHLVESSSIGQYTGLTDKNGKKIFEGDIVVCRMPSFRESIVRKGVVEYYGDSFSVNIKGISPPQDIILFLIKNGSIKIIGNIHDNPELIESEVETE